MLATMHAATMQECMAAWLHTCMYACIHFPCRQKSIHTYKKTHTYIYMCKYVCMYTH